VTSWGKLADAKTYQLTPYLICRRRFAALKKSDSCAEVVSLDLNTLIAALGDRVPIANVAMRSKCPNCGTSHVEIEWLPPGAEPSPPDVQDLQGAARRAAQRTIERHSRSYKPLTFGEGDAD
jgi:hypothetical protein